MTRAERDALRALDFRPRIVVEREQLLALLDAADDRDALKDEMRRYDGSFARAVTKLNALRAVAEQAREALRTIDSHTGEQWGGTIAPALAALDKALEG